MHPNFYEIPEAFRYSYNDDIRMEYQQLYSRLEDVVTRVSGMGRSWVGTKIGKGADYATEIVADGGETNPQRTDIQIRHIYATPYKIPNYLPRVQMLNLGAAGNQYTEGVKKNQMATMARTTDRTIVNGALAAMRVGQDGQDTIELDPDYSVAVDYVRQGAAADSGLTPAKISRANFLFEDNEVAGQGTDSDTSGVTLWIAPAQKQDLLNNPLIMDNQMLFASLEGLREGQVMSVLGTRIRLVSAKILPFDPETKVRTCLLINKDDVYLNDAEPPHCMVDVQPQYEHRTQIVTYACCGAGRMDEKGVLKVYCYEGVIGE